MNHTVMAPSGQCEMGSGLAQSCSMVPTPYPAHAVGGVWVHARTEQVCLKSRQLVGLLVRFCKQGLNHRSPLASRYSDHQQSRLALDNKNKGHLYGTMTHSTLSPSSWAFTNNKTLISLQMFLSTPLIQS